MRDGRLQGVEAVIERQQRVAPEGDDRGFLFHRQDGRMRFLRPGPAIGDALPVLPLGDGLLVDAVAPGELPQALLTILYCSTECRCRGGAAVENLSHSASFHCWENNAPSKSGIKQLGSVLYKLSS